MEAAPGAPAFVKLSAVVQHTMERAYGALVAVMDSAASKNDRERKQLLYEWFVRTRASVIRLLVVLKWARTVPDINHTRDILSFLATEDGLFVSTADNLYTLHQRLQLVKVPIYDVPTAIDVLSTGSYTRLPTSIAAVAGPLVLAAPKEVELKRRVEDMLHYRMFFSFTPPQYSDIRIESDRVVLSVVDEFKASLTADGESLDKHPWRVLDVSVYVGQESDGPVALPPPVLAFVKELLASRLPGAAQPLLELYSILHSFCLSLQLELLSSQTAQMVRGPWQDALWPVYTKDLSLCLYFWTPPPKSGAPADDATYVQVRMDADRALLVSLSPPAPLADPIRLPRPLQAERLLLSAIAAQSLQKLNTLRASLLADAELALKPADASLTTNQSAAGTWHTLVIGLGFDKRFTVGVDGKTGRFVGHMPALADLTTIAPNVNELLNRSPQAAALLIGTLMQQTLLDVFAHLISVYYSSELARVPSLLVEGYELPARALVHRYTDVEHSFIVIDVNKRGRVACTALTTTPVEGGARPLKKVEELSSELDLRDASLSLHERCRRALASAIAAAQWARASRQVLTRFLEARGVRYSVAAPDRVVLPSLAEAEAFMPRLISFAAVEGLWELRVTEGERLLRRPRVEGGNGMRYHGGMWTFPLARLSLPALDELLKSVRGFGRLLRVAALLEGALDAANNAVLGSQFRGPVVYSTSVQLQHVGSDVESTISISYRDDRYALSFGDTQHPLLAFFQAQLNSPVCDARALLEAIDQSLAPCRLLLAFVQPRERTPSAPVPGDFTLVPHHSSQVRLVYRGVFGVDISFLPGRTVAVEDAVKPAMRVVATTLAPVSQLSALLERHATKVNNRFVVPWASLPQALHALYRMVGVQLFLRRTQQLLGDVDPPAKADVQTTRCRLSLRSGQALFLYLHDVSQLEVAASVPGVPPSAPVADALSAEEVDALAVFSRTHVACEPFRLSHFASFLHLLLLPTDSLRQFVRLLAAIERKDVALSLHLALPPLPLPAPAHASSAVVADKATGEVRFAVRLHPGTPHELDAFLRWTPSAARLSSWLPDRALELSVAPGSPLLEQLRALAALPHEARKAALQRQ